MSTYDDARAALELHEKQVEPVTIAEDELAKALRALLGTREDNAPETIAHSVIADRYVEYETFAYAMLTDPSPLRAIAVLNMLKEAAARGMDAREDD